MLGVIRETDQISIFFPNLLQGNVLEYYKQLNQLIVDTYNEENQKIIGCPTTQQVSSKDLS